MAVVRSVAQSTCVEPSFSENIISDSTDGVRAVFAIDMDSDSAVDVVSGTEGDDALNWYANDGEESFTEAKIADAPDAFSVFAVDMDGDGDVDVLLGAYSQVLENTMAWSVPSVMM